MKSISILGVYVADLAFFADEIPIIGETIIGKEYFIGPGGKGSNQAVAAAKAGASLMPSPTIANSPALRRRCKRSSF